MTGLTLIALSFALATLKAPLRRRATTAEGASLPALLVSLPFALLNVVVCFATPVCFWLGIVLLVWGMVRQ